VFSHLGIEWVSAELENALKLVSVGLPHCQGVLATLEDLNLVQSVQVASGEAALPRYCDTGAPLPTFSQPGCLLLVRVPVDHQGKPDSFDIYLSQGVQ